MIRCETSFDVAGALGLSRHTAWRWRMAIIGTLPPEPDHVLAGIVEADEAQQRIRPTRQHGLLTPPFDLYC